MVSLKNFIVLFIVALVGIYPRVNGIQFSKEENLELDAQLSLLNKPPIKTFQDDMGDIIDCIDINKQPAFDHPLLKNHKIQMKPSFIPNWGDAKRPLSMENVMECPEGSISIRGAQKEDLIRAKAFSESLGASIYPSTARTHGKHVAIVRSKLNPKIIYKGIRANINVYNPVVHENHSSTGQIWIENGAPDVVNRLEAGWMVSPALFGDNLPRNFIYWTAGGPNKGCYNLFCPGFVHTDRNFVLGGKLRPSIYGDTLQEYVNYMIYQDFNTGNWWFTYPSHNKTIGYWPKELLPLLAHGASQVTWGGATMGRPDGSASPQMGSGHFPDGDFRHGCYITNMSVLGSEIYEVDPAPPKYQLETFVDDPSCYNVKYFKYRRSHGRFSFLFGGPGGKCRA